MKITIVGAGNGGSTIGADLCLKGHDVTLLKTSQSLHNEHFNILQQNDGRIMFEEVDGSISITKFKKITTDFKTALSDAQIIIVYLQTKYHEDVIKKMSPFLKDGQLILLQPGYLSTLYFKKYCKNVDITVAECVSSFIDCRIIAPGHVKVLFKNVRNQVGVYPSSRTNDVLEKLSVFGYNMQPLKNVVESALHNPNLIVHTIGAIMSIPRIEYTDGNYWMYKEVFTPTVWNIVEQLDKEKMDVLELLGCPRLAYVDACKFRNEHDLTQDSKEVFMYYANNNSPYGPNVPDSRYITEDVPEGLVLLESLGKAMGIKTTACTSLIDLASVALQTDFRAQGRTLEKLYVGFIEDILQL